MKNTMTGNRALLKIKGVTVGSGVQSADFQDDFGLQDVDGLGSPETQELVVGKVSYSVSISSYFIYNKNLIALGFVPETNDILTSGELEIEIIDNVTGTTLEHYVGCKAASHSRNYGKHGIAGQNASFRALTKIK
jgi:hypothetical protein